MKSPRPVLTKAQKLARLDDRRAKLRHEISAEERRADAHRKIKLGGLVIASGVEDWNEAEIVGFLLAAQSASPDVKARCKEAGIKHMEERARAQSGTQRRVVSR